MPGVKLRLSAAGPEKKRLYIFLLALFLLVSLFLNINILPLHFEEPRRSVIAVEMLLTGNYIVPTINGINYYNKPPLFNWILAGGYFLTGTYEEWVGRSVTVLSFLLVAFLLYRIGKKYSSREEALLTSFFWLTSAHIYFFFSHLGEIDLFYTLLVVLQALSVFHFYEKRNFWMLFLFSYLFMGLGVLTKGLPSIVFQALTLVSYFICKKEFRKFFSVAHLSGGVAGCGIAFLYFYQYSKYHSPLPFLLNLISESSDRLVSEAWWDSIKHLVFFPLDHIQIILPWGLLGLLLLHKQVRKGLSGSNLIQFCLLFIAVNVVPYWLAPGTRDRYLYPLVPFAMIIFAHLAVKYYPASGYKRFIDAVFLVFTVALALAVLTLPFFSTFQSLTHIGFVSIISFMVFGGLAWLNFKYPAHRIWTIIVVMVAARWVYDVTVLPSKAMSAAERRPYEKYAREINGIAEGRKIFYYGPVKQEPIAVPFFQDIEVDSVASPYFTMSFYYSTVSGQVLLFTQEKRNGEIYLSEDQYLEGENIEELAKYYIPETNRRYTLFKFRQ